jgi:DNA uptake protein ComE-like DNA-binding protein
VVFSQIDLLKRVEGWEISTSLVRSVCRYVQHERMTGSGAYDTLADLNKERVHELGIGRVNYTLADEESRIDVNTASADVLARLPGINDDLARNITASSLRPFTVLEELLLIEGFDQALLDKCREWITVHSYGRVNINTAAVEVLQALGIDEVSARIVADFRSGPDRVSGTADDGYFADIAEVDQKLRAFAWLSDVQKAKIADLVSGGSIVVSSENVTLKAQTFILGEPSMKYAVVLDQNRIRRWQEW